MWRLGKRVNPGAEVSPLTCSASFSHQASRTQRGGGAAQEGPDVRAVAGGGSLGLGLPWQASGQEQTGGT